MYPAITSFLTDPIIAEHDPAGDLTEAFLILERQTLANGNASARSFLRTCAWILAQEERAAVEKFDAMHKVIAFAKANPGCHCVIPSMRKFLDWPSP